jgi:predicted helicase
VSFDPKPFSEYVSTVEKTLATGHASEGSHYPTLKALLELVGEGVVATILPSRIECGAPDFLVTKGPSQVGYVEAKDVGKSLDEAEKSEQLKRYRDSLSNLILTDYLEFRWYRDGKCELEAKLGTVDTAGKIKREKKGIEEVAKLLIEFFSSEAPGVGTPKELAVRMARLAHRIREGAEEALNKSIASDLLSGLHKAFQGTLIPGLEIKVFADMYAQTIAYGLFAARCETDDASKFNLKDATDLIPKTNPFLKDLFYQITGPHINDEPYKWAVDELVQVLKKADMTEIVKGLSKGTGKSDPVVYFYEDFLREYDKKISEMRGVYYTPIPVVSYIVSSIAYLLKNRFNRPQGLADENTYILDPATGTGTFLYAVINEIYESMSKQGQMGKWDGYVAGHLLPRIFGFELLMAPYVIAHLKLGLQLRNTGYTFHSKERLGVYLTNTLEEAVKSSEMLMAQYIVKEANAAAEIKKEKPIMVVLGNPPYSGTSANASMREFLDPKTGKRRRKLTWIGELIEGVFDKDGNEIIMGYKRVDGKPLDEKNPKWLQDDYVKFIRFGQWRIQQTGQGILGFITNHSYLDNPTFRGMRQSLLNTFNEIYVIDLHGNAKKRETAPDGGKDENVFDIQQGVAIGIFVKEAGKTGPAEVYHSDHWGLRERKYHALFETDITDTDWSELKPSSPFYLFVPRHEELLSEYNEGWKITDVFPVNSVAPVTARDSLVIDFSEVMLRDRITALRSESLQDDAIKQKFQVNERKGWILGHARKLLREDGDWEQKYVRCTYKPFDQRHFYYHRALLERPRIEVARHLFAHKNVALIATRTASASNPFSHIFATCHIPIGRTFPDLAAITYLFPLYLYLSDGTLQGKLEAEEACRPNLNPEFIKAVSEKLGLKFVDDGKGDLAETFGPEDIFNYAYALFHSPTYRSRYAEFLKIDFPRLPLTSNKELFKALVGKGAEFVALHLMESPTLNNLITKYPISGSSTVEKVSYDETTKRVYINKSQYFEGVEPEVCNFQIGGYQVCEKWLKDRKGRTLTYDDLTHYQKVIAALKETIQLMKEVDALIPSWPLQ